jgi:hypothetical protein
MTPPAAAVAAAPGQAGTPSPPGEVSSHLPGTPSGSGRKAVPATRQGRCECCHTSYPAGSLVVWDAVGLVLQGHRSVRSRW